MTTTSEPTNALAQQDLNDRQIRQRIELNKQAGWGLEKGTPAQLNMVFLICQKYELLPGEDLTLYDGKPWITIDGRVKLMRRHPEYRGFKTRPLTAEEKESWGYDPDDLVVEATIRTTTWGDITEHGKVSKAEREGAKAEGQRLNYVARIHPVEMAKKRALARAERFAFGQDAMIDDEQAEQIARTVIEERNNPERIAAGARRHAEIFGADEDHAFAELPNHGAHAPEPPEEQAAPVAPTRTELWTKNKELTARANALGFAAQLTTLSNRSKDEDIAAQNAELEGRIRAHEAGLNATTGDEVAQEQESF